MNPHKKMGIWFAFFSVLIVACVPGALAAPFANWTALKAAVDSCLAVDPTGVACCNSGANCGAAGTDEMDKWDVSLVTSLYMMFGKKMARGDYTTGYVDYPIWSATAFNADISGWNVSSVTSMGDMFNGASAFNADISGWDVSSVTSMGGMFDSASAFNADISGWDVSSVTDMRRMLWYASALNADISGWDVSSVTEMEDMFHGAAMILVPSWYLGTCPAGHSGGNGQSCTACAAGESTLGRTGAATCTACAAGQSTQGATGAATCTACVAGESTLGETGAATCTPCAAGQSTQAAGIAAEYTGATGAATCTACAAGKYTGATGSATCTACAVGESTLGETGAVSCTTCPKGTWSGKAGQADCIACNQADWCPGGNSCAEGHQGEACFECVKDWYMLQGVCYPCKQDARFFLLVFLGMSVFFVFIAAVVFPGKIKAGWKRLQRAKKQAKDTVEKMQEKIQRKTLGERSSKVGAVVFLVSLITYLQIQTLVVSVTVPWPSAMTAFFGALGDIVNFDAWGFINPKCSFDPGFTVNWMVRFFSPFLILLVVAGGIAFTPWRSNDHQALNGVFRLVVQVLQVTFVGNVVHALQPLDCAEYACDIATDAYCSKGTYRVMESNPSIVCDLNPEWSPFLFCSLLGILGYVVCYMKFIFDMLVHVNTLARKHRFYIPSNNQSGGAARLLGGLAPAPPPPPPPFEPSPTMMASIQEMGFSEPQARVALVAVRGQSIEIAMEWLFTHPEEAAAADEAAAAAAATTTPAQPISDGRMHADEESTQEPFDDNAGPMTDSVLTVDADETTDPSEEEEEEQFERMIRRTHPDIQLLIRRYGLLFLPYSQRTWGWEIVAMARKSLMALTAVFFTTTPIRQLKLMLAQNVSWLALLIWFRPFTVVPMMGGPLEKIYEEERAGETRQRWSSGNIVEIGMACGTVALNVIGLTVGDGDSTAQLAFFFAQLGIVGVLITRAIQCMGDESVSFFGSVGDRIWGNRGRRSREAA